MVREEAVVSLAKFESYPRAVGTELSDDQRAVRQAFRNAVLWQSRFEGTFFAWTRSTGQVCAGYASGRLEGTRR